MSPDTITAICAIVISVFATVLAACSAFAQRKHMRLSVQPIAAVPVADYEDRLGVFVANKGLGPMRIKKLVAQNKDGLALNNIIDHMPPLPDDITWRNFNVSLAGATLEHGQRFELLVLEGNPQNDEFRDFRNKVRKVLKDLSVRVEYEDLYKKPMDPIEEQLTFFGRHFSE